MERLAILIQQLTMATDEERRVRALTTQLAKATPEDAAWLIWLFQRPQSKRRITLDQLRDWALEVSGLPEWLFNECEAALTDPAEVFSLLCGSREDLFHSTESPPTVATLLSEIFQVYSELSKTELKQAVQARWKSLSCDSSLIFHQLLLGKWKPPITHRVLEQALSEWTELPRALLGRRLQFFEPTVEALRLLIEKTAEQRWELPRFCEIREWKPAAPLSASSASRLFALTAGSKDLQLSLLEPFEASSGIEAPVSQGYPALESPVLEWSYEAERLFLVRKPEGAFVWSEARSWVTESYPSLVQAGLTLPNDCIVEGVCRETDSKNNSSGETSRGLPGAPLNRISLGADSVSASAQGCMKEYFEVCDLLELEGADLRTLPLRVRRAKLEDLLRDRSRKFRLTPWLFAESFDEIKAFWKDVQSQGARGIRFRSMIAPYVALEYEWRTECPSFKAVLLYSHGRGGECTFAIRNGMPIQGKKPVSAESPASDSEPLVPVVRAALELSDAELDELESWIRKNTREKFGPIRSVEPVHVFEIGFSSIMCSSRHKSGLSLKSPRVLRWVRDHEPDAIDTLQSLLSRIHI